MTLPKVPAEAVQATNDAVSEVMRARVSKAPRKASDDRYKKREDRPSKLPRSGASFRKEARSLEHRIQANRLPEHLDAITAGKKAKELRQKSHEVSEATRSGRS